MSISNRTLEIAIDAVGYLLKVLGNPEHEVARKELQAEIHARQIALADEFTVGIAKVEALAQAYSESFDHQSCHSKNDQKQDFIAGWMEALNTRHTPEPLGERYLLTEADGTLPKYGSFSDTAEPFKHCHRPAVKVLILRAE